jgi:LPS export ABC transporter protein LptC
MMFRPLALAFTGVLAAWSLCAADSQPLTNSDQQISEFSLAGFGDRGKKTWDLNGKSADILAETIRLKDIVGNMYGEKENIKLTAKQGDFDKKDNKMHLQDDVVITTSSGAKLTTNSLDWDRKQNLVKTNDVVNIERQNMTGLGQGAEGHTDLNQVKLERDVKIDIALDAAQKPQGDSGKSKLTITCDGPMSVDYQKNIATFSSNVRVDREGSQIYSDTMDVYFTQKSGEAAASGDSAAMSSNIEKIVCKGNVKIVRGENVSYSDEAVYTMSDRKITLSGKPRLVIYSTEGMDAPFGN